MSERIRVLCVDDEPNVLEGLLRNLRRDFELETANGAIAALQLLPKSKPFAVVLSDLRMPGLDGISLFRRLRQQAPDTVRVLLTGNADLDSAQAAVNEGEVFRFLRKPCPAEMLVATLRAAAEQHRLLTSERVLLEQTLHGSIELLTDVLALASPAAFGHALRVRKRASDLLEKIDAPRADRWSSEMAALLSQLGCITLPTETVEKMARGSALSADEEALVAGLPLFAAHMVRRIPRLESIDAVLSCAGLRFDGEGSEPGQPSGDLIPLGARLLRLLLDADALERTGASPASVVETLALRTGVYDPMLLERLREEVASCTEGGSPLRELTVRELCIGMTLADDVYAGNGMLLAARGHDVTPGMLERLRNFARGAGVQEPLRVLTTPPSAAS